MFGGGVEAGMSAIGRLLLFLLVVLLPVIFAALVWAVAFHFNPPKGVGRTQGGQDLEFLRMR
jgi:hypothetical protein